MFSYEIILLKTGLNRFLLNRKYNKKTFLKAITCIYNLSFMICYTTVESACYNRIIEEYMINLNRNICNIFNHI